MQYSDTIDGGLSRCASVLSTQSKSGKFYQVQINEQPVIVPLEYISRLPNGNMECLVSGLKFPISTAVEISLEQGPQDSSSSDTISDASLDVPSAVTSTPDISLDEDRIYTVHTGSGQFRVAGRDILPHPHDEESYCIKINNEIVTVSEIEDEGADEQSIYSLAPGFSGSELAANSNYRVMVGGREVIYPGSKFYPTDVQGKYIITFQGGSVLVENPAPWVEPPAPWQSRKNVSPFSGSNGTYTAFSDLNDVNFRFSKEQETSNSAISSPSKTPAGFVTHHATNLPSNQQNPTNPSTMSVGKPGIRTTTHQSHPTTTTHQSHPTTTTHQSHPTTTTHQSHPTTTTHQSHPTTTTNQSHPTTTTHQSHPQYRPYFQQLSASQIKQQLQNKQNPEIQQPQSQMQQQNQKPQMQQQSQQPQYQQPQMQPQDQQPQSQQPQMQPQSQQPQMQSQGQQSQSQQPQMWPQSQQPQMQPQCQQPQSQQTQMQPKIQQPYMQQPQYQQPQMQPQGQQPQMQPQSQQPQSQQPQMHPQSQQPEMHPQMQQPYMQQPQYQQPQMQQQGQQPQSQQTQMQQPYMQQPQYQQPQMQQQGQQPKMQQQSQQPYMQQPHYQQPQMQPYSQQPQNVADTFQVVSVQQEMCGSPFSPFDDSTPVPVAPNISNIPSFTTQLLQQSLQRTDSSRDNFEVIEYRTSPIRSILKTAPSPISKHVKLTTPGQSPPPVPASGRLSPEQKEIVNDYFIKSATIEQTTTIRKTKPKFFSPAAYMPYVIKPVEKRRRPEAPWHRVTLSSSSEDESQHTPPPPLPDLPGVDSLIAKVSTIQKMHMNAFISESSTDPTTSSPVESDVDEKRENYLANLLDINCLGEKVAQEIRTGSRQSRVSSSSSDTQDEEPEKVFEKVLQLSNLPGLNELAMAADQHKQSVKETFIKSDDGSSDDLNEEEQISLKLQNLPGLDNLLDAVERVDQKKPTRIHFSPGEETDSALLYSTSLGSNLNQTGGIHSLRSESASSMNTLKNVDDITSVTSRNRSPNSQALSPETDVVEYYRVLIGGVWFTARDNQLKERQGETYMILVDGEVKRVQQCVRVPGVRSPAGGAYLCDSKMYTVTYKSKTYSKLGSEIVPCAGGRFLIYVNGDAVTVSTKNISEQKDCLNDFEKLKNVVALKIYNKWKVLASHKLVPSASNIGKYYVKRNGKAIFIEPNDVYPILKNLDLPLGCKPVPQSYIIKLKGRLVKVPISSLSLSKSQEDTVLIRHKGNKHAIKITSLIPHVEAERPGEDASTTNNTSSFSAVEYKNNLYCINIDGKTVTVPGTNIKPHKNRQGYCKMRYRGKIYRIKSVKLKLARQCFTTEVAIGAVTNNLAIRNSSNSSANLPQKPVIRETISRLSNPRSASPKSPAPEARKDPILQPIMPPQPSLKVKFPNFSQLLKQVPVISPTFEELLKPQPKDRRQHTKQQFNVSSTQNLWEAYPSTDDIPAAAHPATDAIKGRFTISNIQRSDTVVATSSHQRISAPLQHPPKNKRKIRRKQRSIKLDVLPPPQLTIKTQPLSAAPTKATSPRKFTVSNLRCSPMLGQNVRMHQFSPNSLEIKPIKVASPRKFTVSNIRCSPTIGQTIQTQQISTKLLAVNAATATPSSSSSRHFALSNLRCSPALDAHAACATRPISPNRLVIKCDSLVNIPVNNEAHGSATRGSATRGSSAGTMATHSSATHVQQQAGSCFSAGVAGTITHGGVTATQQQFNRIDFSKSNVSQPQCNSNFASARDTKQQFSSFLGVIKESERSDGVPRVGGITRAVSKGDGIIRVEPSKNMNISMVDKIPKIYY